MTQNKNFEWKDYLKRCGQGSSDTQDKVRHPEISHRGRQPRPRGLKELVSLELERQPGGRAAQRSRSPGSRQRGGRKAWPLSVFPPLRSPETDWWPDPAEATGQGAWARRCRGGLWGAAERGRGEARGRGQPAQTVAVL